jgi:small subunit ribosomal protein S14
LPADLQSAPLNRSGIGSMSQIHFSFFMIKKCHFQRELKKEIFIKKYAFKRAIYLRNNCLDFKFKLQKLPRNSSIVRLRNRCWKTGKARGVFRFFGLCRNAFRELAHDSLLPGIVKASW